MHWNGTRNDADDNLKKNIKNIKKNSTQLPLQLAMVLEPHLHLIVEVREQGPQTPSWHSFSHRWIESKITFVCSVPERWENNACALHHHALPVWATHHQQMQSLGIEISSFSRLAVCLFNETSMRLHRQNKDLFGTTQEKKNKTKKKLMERDVELKKETNWQAQFPSQLPIMPL